jgi:hypothetical protein
VPNVVRIASNLKPRVRLNADGGMTIMNITGQTLFSPSQPVYPYAQSPGQGAIGRQFDYQTGYNLQWTPRSDEAIGFPQLRALAENYDILRLVLETRKDQLQSLDWTIAPRHPDADEAIAKDVLDFMQYPDRVHDYDTWSRVLMEDMFVIDAATIYPRMTNGGKLYSLDYMDGSLITPKIDAAGRTPDPGQPAYQQIIKGLAAVNYSHLPEQDQPDFGGDKLPHLIYRPRNMRSWKVYGYSPVEQIIVSVNIALRRQMFQLDFYREGSIPDAFGSLPETWNPQQIAEFQGYWDQLFENPTGQNAGMRRKMRWTPKGDITFAKDAVLKDEYDEWLARVCCYAFSVPPTPFVKQMNRATAQAQADAAKTEGLLPLKRWWKSTMDYILARVMKRPDLEFQWQDEEELDPAIAAVIEDTNIRNGSITIDAARAARGQDPYPGGLGSKPMVYTGQGATLLADVLNPPDPVAPLAPVGPDGNPVGAKPAEDKPEPSAAQKLAAVADLKKAVKKKYIERRPTMIQRQRMTRGLKRAFREQVKIVTAQAAPRLAKATGDDGFDWDAIFGVIPPAATHPLQLSAADGVKYGATEVGSGVGIGEGFVNDWSVGYARDRAAEMIGMKWIDGELVANPEAEWAITDETREAVNRLVTQAIEDGWTTDKLTEELETSYAFSPQRAEAIARTETRMADGSGRQAAWRESGVVRGKVWLIGDDNPCDDCTANADAGEIDLEDSFPSGSESEPEHPNCNCVVSPIVYNDEAGADE